MYSIFHQDHSIYVVIFFNQDTSYIIQGRFFISSQWGIINTYWPIMQFHNSTIIGLFAPDKMCTTQCKLRKTILPPIIIGMLSIRQNICYSKII